jgi:hypothetical protein
MNKNHQKNNKEALKAMMNIGIERTKYIITEFMSDKPLNLTSDEGLLLSLYLNYHQEKSVLNESLNSFIGLVFYKGLKK